MEKVPQFVLKRLKEAPPVTGSHPDADVLTAFAEQSLAGDERANVMEHLARCGDCRDVLALALPATEIVTLPASASTARIGWLSWPALRWGALAAGILAVTTVGVVEYSHRNSQTTLATNRVRESLAAPLASSEAPHSPVTVPRGEMNDMKKKALAAPASPRLSAPFPAAPPPAFAASRAAQPAGAAKSMFSAAVNGNAYAQAGSGSGGGIGSGSRGGVLPNRDKSFAYASPRSPAVASPEQNPAPEMHEQVQVGAASETVEVAAGNGAVTTESATISQNQIAQNQKDLPLNGRNVTDLNTLDVVKAKNPVPGQAAARAAAPQLASTGPLQTSATLMVRALPRWTVSSSGVLQRSFDGGNTWENVSPAVNAAAFGGSVGGPIAKENTARADAAEFSKQKVAPSPNPAPMFRAVTAAGLEVWAGGSDGALYHTADGGNRWIRVVPAAAGAVLAGDIVSIQFADTQHGRISTSTGELWTTSDAGQTWQKQ
jgi:hypothetical protein